MVIFNSYVCLPEGNMILPVPNYKLQAGARASPTCWNGLPYVWIGGQVIFQAVRHTLDVPLKLRI